MFGLAPFIPAATAATLGGLDLTADHVGYTKRNLWGIAAGITRWLFGFLAIIFLVLIIYGGITWMTARGDSKKVATAQDTIRDSVIGLIVISAAYAITTFIGDFAIRF